MNHTCLINNDIMETVVPDNFQPVNLVVTSPPYNLDIAYDTHLDNKTYAAYMHWCEGWIRKLYNWVDDDGRVCVNVPFKITPPQDSNNNYPISADYIALFQKVGFKFFNQIVWDKGIIPSKTCWGSRESASSPFVRDPAETILIFYKNQWKRKNADPGNRKSTVGKNFYKWTTNVWPMKSEQKSKVGGHPASFPLDLPTRCIHLFSYKNDIVMDPFMGSGTTGESAIIEGRNFVGIELSKQYFEFSKSRIDGAAAASEARQMIMSEEVE